jgi:hypothetical protein
MLANSLPLACPPGEQFTRAAHIAGAVRLADVKPQNTRWLWPGRIPLGRVTLLVSDPGLGKSLLALDIAARVSTGANWPDECAKQPNSNATSSDHSSFDIGHSSFTPPNPQSEIRNPKSPASALLLTSEDDLADTIRPRLEALGADCEKILAINSIPGENTNDVPRAFALNRDLARLRSLLDAVPDCRLIIIDPVSAFLGGTNEHSNADVRALLAALTTIARDRNLAVLMVSHLRKKEGAAIYRTMGSLAFVAAARAVWLVSKDPADSNKRLLMPLKSNLAPDATALAFVIESDGDRRASRIRWSPDSVTVTPDSLLDADRPVGRPDDDRQRAIQWLRQRLAKGPQPARDVIQEAKALAISYGTLRRALRDLGGQAARQSNLPTAPWLWKLPRTDAQNDGGEFCAPVYFPDQLADRVIPWMPPKTLTTSTTDI